MSHIATLKTKIKDLRVLKATCRELDVLVEIKRQGVRLYSNTVDAVACIKLPGWTYPVAVCTDGTIKDDNFKGCWGAHAELKRGLRAYSSNAARRTPLAASGRGH